MSYYKVKEIYPWLHAIIDPFENCHIYVAVGTKSALVFDTGHGFAPLIPEIKKITDLPFTLVLSHGHGDHADGAIEFEEAYISEADFELCLRHTGRTARRRIVAEVKELPIALPSDFDEEAYIAKGAAEAGLADKLKILAIGHVFDIGGKTVEVVPLEGHTSGCIGLLFKEDKVLLSSDGITPYLQWAFLNESLPVSAFVAQLERSLTLDFDTMLDAHSGRPYTKDDVARFKQVMENIDLSKTTDFPKVPEFGGKLYTEGEFSIVIRADKLI